MNKHLRGKTEQWLRRLMVVTLAMALPAAWADSDSATERAIKTRQASYYLMAQQMARINATIKGDLPFDKAALELSADLLVLLSKSAPQSYPAGSDQGVTKAKAEIWKELPRFNKLAQEAQGEAGKLKAAVSTGDAVLIKAAYGAASRSCKACHDTYKLK